MNRSTAALVLVLAMFGSISLAKSDDELKNDELKDLACVQLLVEELSEDARRADITEEGLKDSLLVAVKSKLPRLKISDHCPDVLYLNVTFLDIQSIGGTKTGFASSVRLEVKRMVTVLLTGSSMMAAIWHTGGLVSGPPGKPAKKSGVTGAVEDYVTDFAAAYYKAENP